MSSRNWRDIGKTLGNAKQKFSPPVELNKHSIFSAVETSIRYKTEELAILDNYDTGTRKVVERYSLNDADDIFF
ncbi:unnamed protein product, partial [Clonostachys solani]